MAPLAELNDECMNLSSASISPSKALDTNKGGILYLEVLELKEEIALEKEDLDYLHQQSNETLKNRNALHKENRKIKSISELELEIEELQQLCEDLDEEIEMHVFETKMIEAHNDELKRQIEAKLRQPSEPRPSRRSSMIRRTSRYLRHQKRRQSAPLVTAPSA